MLNYATTLYYVAIRKISLVYNFATAGYLILTMNHHNVDSVLVVGYEPEVTCSVTIMLYNSGGDAAGQHEMTSKMMDEL